MKFLYLLLACLSSSGENVIIIVLSLLSGVGVVYMYIKYTVIGHSHENRTEYKICEITISVTVLISQ